MQFYLKDGHFSESGFVNYIYMLMIITKQRYAFISICSFFIQAAHYFTSVLIIICKE